MRGGNGICDGAVHSGNIRDIIAKCNAAGFGHFQVRFICVCLIVGPICYFLYFTKFRIFCVIQETEEYEVSEWVTTLQGNKIIFI